MAILFKRGPVLGLVLAVLLWWGVAARTHTAAAPPDRVRSDAPRPRLGAPAPPSTVLGTISGHVMLDGGKPAAGFTVRAGRFLRGSEDTTMTGLDGRYTLTLHPPGPHNYFSSGPVWPPGIKGYAVSVSNGGRPYVEPPPQTVDVDAKPGHAVSGVDFVLRLGPQITVRARDALTGAPDPGLTIRYRGLMGGSQTAGVTGSDGGLRFRVPYTDVGLEVALSDDQSRTLQDAPGYGFSREVKAAPGEEVPWDIKTYGRVAAESDWHGVVRGLDGRPAAGVPVLILRQWGGASLVTDAQGRFSARLPRLDRGETFDGQPHPVVYVQRGALVAAQVVTPDESWDGMTLRLTPGAVLTGTLTDGAGHPAAGAGVTLNGLLFGSVQGPSPSTVTDAAGRWTLAGLAAGEYQILIHGGGYGTVTVPTAPTDPHVAPPRLALAAGQRRDLGLLTVPHADRTLSGRVVDGRGAPVPGLYIQVTGAHTNQTAATQPDGTFRVYGVVAEPVTVAAGVTGQSVTAEATPTQKEVRLVAPADVIATTGRGSSASPPVPPRPNPTGPPKVTPAGASAHLNGLSLDLSPRADGAVLASLFRLNDVGPFANLNFARPQINQNAFSPPRLWQGTLADLDGMRLTVRKRRGTLTDRAGRPLWAGVVQDPPDYVVSSVINYRGPGGVVTTVRDGRGHTLWSGVGGADDGWDAGRDGNLRIVGANQAVAWERAVGDARVAVRESGPAAGFSPDPTPADGTLTLHVVPATATLRAADGRVLWSGPTSAVTATTTGFPPPPPVYEEGKVSRRFILWELRRETLAPTGPLTLLDIENVPHGATMTLTDAQGKPLSGGRWNYP